MILDILITFIIGTIIFVAWVLPASLIAYHTIVDLTASIREEGMTVVDVLLSPILLVLLCVISAIPIINYSYLREEYATPYLDAFMNFKLYKGAKDEPRS